jgi:glycosyltransferase involved in cell wall biosynthesis
VHERLPLRAPTAPASIEPAPVPTLSVLVPAYNAADTIGEALESALVQRPAADEIIVSDDGSEDDLPTALRPFLGRVTVVTGPNGGLATARNRAATAASGQLLGLLDADDVWLPGRVAALTMAAAARPDLSVFTTDAVVVRDGQADRETYYDTRDFYLHDQVDGILRNNFIFGAGAVRSHAFRSVGGYRSGARYAEDWDLWLRLLLRGHRAGLVDLPLYEYRRREGSLTRQKLELALGVLKVLEAARPLVPTPAHKRRLQVTQQEWREAAARLAEGAGDRRARRLSLRAAAGRRAAHRTRLRFAVSAALPSAVLVARYGRS